MLKLSRTLGGHARFARADVQAIKATRSSKKPISASPAVSDEESLTPVGVGDALPAAQGAEHDETKTVSLEIEKAMLAAEYGLRLIEHLDELRDGAVQRTTGLPAGEVFLRLWSAPVEQVANGIGLEEHVLRRICKLYEIPLPPKGYFRTSITRRSIRITRLPASE